MNDEKYNGWSNKETWIVNMWLNSEQNMYHIARDVLTDKKTNLESKRDIMIDWLLSSSEEVLGNAPMLDDLIRYTMFWRVNWEEINDSFNEE